MNLVVLVKPGGKISSMQVGHTSDRAKPHDLQRKYSLGANITKATLGG